MEVMTISAVAHYFKNALLTSQSTTHLTEVIAANFEMIETILTRVLKEAGCDESSIGTLGRR
ncbi:hypothetical protein J6590_061353 [Homalodisca vitripennis]|nr:hypothetical protein J6590_061353 [Homalodisca vitripennis]